MKPDYRKIYQDIIELKHPEKEANCRNILQNEVLSLKDVMKLNSIIFENVITTSTFNQRHKSYDKEMIFYILDYQKKNKLNNIQLAAKFKMSRNTVTKWKKLFR
ncbi:helix-turn-helix domain-containing protein [Chryseobacterium aureum]|uniref:helix-turn-helix domain-containing protein n=1 Tax=Chryseobacterium aureum TaxID=2497456 RepID=UPI000F873DB9|nr:helix-turn-helix domain-containing protein [Chryseobacterium aureum]